MLYGHHVNATQRFSKRLIMRVPSQDLSRFFPRLSLAMGVVWSLNYTSINHSVGGGGGGGHRDLLFKSRLNIIGSHQDTGFSNSSIIN